MLQGYYTVMEKHSGVKEKTERFDGKQYKKIGHSYSKPKAESRASGFRKKWDSVRVEPESRGHYNLYGRGRKR